MLNDIRNISFLKTGARLKKISGELSIENIADAEENKLLGGVRVG